jgi:hypothetical protein
MKDALTSAALFALYHASVAVGILVLPVALLVRKAGVSVPLERVLSRLADAYESH